jgi:ethanolamine utilization protein EutM
MKEKALGVIETFGLVPAIEAADIGLKTADVSVDSLEKTGAGLVAIILRGDVSSVKAAVEAGSLAAGRLGRVVSTTVIARTAEGLESILATGSANGPRKSEPPCPSEPGHTTQTPENEAPSTAPMAIEHLRALNVVQLRTYVRILPEYPMTREEIRSARKEALLAKIADYYRDKGIPLD